ncbi:MAG: hypothetical protein IMZ64_13870 [Bacteroidetes bacterium]|nr:hypothetical protein [Bacteroidota bacterium]
MSLIDDIKLNEGFRGLVYKDTLGFDTIGYGTKLPLTEEEGELILQHRLGEKIEELNQRMPLYRTLPIDKRQIIAEMAYQLGVSGVINFKNMWKALGRGDYNSAAVEMLDSRWAKQTPTRAKKLAEKMRL